MAQFRAFGWSFLCVATLANPLWAQDAHRIWGQVHTADDEVLEGFIRWDRNEGSWVDILNGSKEIPEETYQAWLQSNELDGRPLRSIDLKGYRITWEEDDPDFPSLAASGIRFGHLRSLRVVGIEDVELLLKSGQVVELQGGSTDIGRNMRELLVDIPGGEEVELRWRELDRIEFAAAPPGVRARSRRLYGTLEDRRGERVTGYVSWDLDEILETDILDGEEMDGGDDREIRFGDIQSISRIGDGALVVLKNGDELELTGTNDVDKGHRGVQISDPSLGMVEVEWRQFRTLEFHDAEAITGYDAFDGGHPLVGTVITQAGEEIDGIIRWDADEDGSWELLNGHAGDAEFTIELGMIARIERGRLFGAMTTLLDGRTFELTDSNDVDWDNKGIFIAPMDTLRSDSTETVDWRMVTWDEFKEIRFRHDAAIRGSGEGS